MKVRYGAIGLVTTVILLLISCGKAPGTESTSNAVSSDVVATIGDYTITKEQLQTRLSQEVRPKREDIAVPRSVPTAESVLREMVAEKAMAMEGRAAGYLNEESTADWLEQVRQRRLIPLLLVAYVDQAVPVSDEQIDEVLQANPQLTRENARRQFQSSQAAPVLQAYYKGLLEKYHVQKVRDNFVKAARIHQRLLTKPVTPRGTNVSWITIVQLHDELSQEEKDLVLATYDGGKVTLYDWFKAVCQLAPPSRPKDLSTAAGVEKFLDSALQPVILMAEARAQGFDKAPDFVAEMRKTEDTSAMGLVQGKVNKEVPLPTDEEAKAYYEAHPERFGSYPNLTMDELWCRDRQSAEAVEKMLVDGASVEAVTEAHPEVQVEEAVKAYASDEGFFWNELWAGEPNGVVGPVRGFGPDGIHWRVVRILKKTPGQVKPFDENIKARAQTALQTERLSERMKAYEAELLDKYPHKIYADRIADIDPLAVTPAAEGSEAPAQR